MTKKSTSMLGNVLIVILGIIIGSIPFIFDNNLSWGIIFFLVILSALVYLNARHPSTIMKIILIAFILRGGFAVLNAFFNIFPPKIVAVRYSLALDTFASSLRHGHIIYPFKAGTFLTSLPYLALVAPIYIILGSTPLTAQMLNIVISLVTVFNIYRISKELFNAKTGKTAAIIMALFPSTIYLSGVFQRDSLVVLLISEVIYLVILWLRHGKIKNLLLALAITIPILGILRPEHSIILIISIAFSYLFFTQGFGRFINNRRKNITRILFILIMVFVLASVVVLLIGYPQYIYKGYSNGFNIDFLESFHEQRTSGGSVYLENIVFDSWKEVLFYAPLKAAYFLFVPFPWQIKSLNYILAFLDSFLSFGLMILSINGFKYLFKKDKATAIFMLTYFIVGVLAYGIIESNVGAALRHRQQFNIILIIFASYYISKNFVKKFAKSVNIE